MQGNPYKILEVSVSDSKDVVKAKYRALCRIYHPDNIKTGNEEKFLEVKRAFEYLNENTSRSPAKGTKMWRHKTAFTVVKA